MNLTELNKAIADLYAVQNPQPKAQRERLDNEIVELQKQKDSIINDNPDVIAINKQIDVVQKELRLLKIRRNEIANALESAKQIDAAIGKLRRAKSRVDDYDYGRDEESRYYDFEASILVLVQRWASELGVSEDRFFKYWQKIKETVFADELYFDYNFDDRIDEFRQRTDALIELINLVHGE